MTIIQKKTYLHLAEQFWKPLAEKGTLLIYIYICLKLYLPPVRMFNELILMFNKLISFSLNISNSAELHSLKWLPKSMSQIYM